MCTLLTALLLLLYTSNSSPSDDPPPPQPVQEAAPSQEPPAPESVACPPGIHLQPSRIPAAGTGAWASLVIAVGTMYGPYLGKDYQQAVSRVLGGGLILIGLRVALYSFR